MQREMTMEWAINLNSIHYFDSSQVRQKGTLDLWGSAVDQFWYRLPEIEKSYKVTWLASEVKLNYKTAQFRLHLHNP